MAVRRTSPIKNNERITPDNADPGPGQLLIKENRPGNNFIKSLV